MHRAVDSQAAERFTFSEQAEPFRLGQTEPRVHGYAWRHSAPSASLVLLHGFQSHAQWFAEAGDLLLEQGFSVYAIDRRGSGSSPYERGHVRRYQDWFDEVAEVVREAKSEQPEAPVHLVGHCFGANVALGYVLTHRPSDVASVAMLTPGLYVHQDYTVPQKLRLIYDALRCSPRHHHAPQQPEDFSFDEDLVAWIHGDSLGAQTATGRCLFETGKMMRFLRHNVGRVDVPILVFEAARDRISDNARNRAAFEGAVGDRCRFVTFDAEHFLLAEPVRDDVLDELASWASEGEAA